MKIILRGGPCDGKSVQVGPRVFRYIEEHIKRKIDTGAVEFHLRHVYSDSHRKEGRFRVFDFLETREANAEQLKALTAKRRAVDVAIRAIRHSSADELIAIGCGQWPPDELRDARAELRKVLKVVREMAEEQ